MTDKDDLDRCIEFLRSFGAYDHWADEIERLRADNETLRTNVMYLADKFKGTP